MERAVFWASAALFFCAGSQTLFAAETPGAMTGQTLPMSPQVGGYGPVRLEMTQADVKRVLNSIASDVVFLPMSVDHPLNDMADNRLNRMVVMTPWEDVYVGRLDTNTLIQVGTHGGRVVSVMLRTRLAAQGQACRSAFLGLVKRNEVEFGPVPVADMPGNSQLLSDGKVDFEGWTLRLGRIQAGATCNLTADYISNSDSKIEASWRARLP
jgi:hypothetical protein